MSPVGSAVRRLRLYATSREGGHLMPLGVAYSPEGRESVSEAEANFKADILLVLDAFTEPVEPG